MKQELRIFLTALMFYTRIPSPYKFKYDEKYMRKSTRYFPVMGWIVGGVSALVFIGSNSLFSVEISTILSMMASLLTTGAFHEDGLADVADGFGGGWEKEKILTIMKDSAIGTYGALALVLALLLKFVALSETVSTPYALSYSSSIQVAVILISGHSVSRFVAITTIMRNQYVRSKDKTNKVGLAITQETSSWLSLMTIPVLFGLAPLLLFGTYKVVILLVPMFLAQYLMIRFFKKRIGGYTGDCLGAIQQVCEIVFYLGVLVLWKFI